MNYELSDTTEAILLLTSPLIVGREMASINPLSLGEYKKLVRFLMECKKEPADLLSSESDSILREYTISDDPDRIRRLLDRGLLLGQAIDRWQARSIWVVSRADKNYPDRLKVRLKENAPPVLYGCGNIAIVNSIGLAVVGSRNANDEQLVFTESIGRQCAKSGITIVSGGARGVDQASMRGALESGGLGVGILADSLERAVLHRENRDMLMNGKLVLISPYDPALRFIVGNAMQRNKMIYALAEAGLVVSADYNKGGTWAGAVEQLDKLKLVPVYVRMTGNSQAVTDGLLKKGAKPWTETDVAALIRDNVKVQEKKDAYFNIDVSMSVHDAQDEHQSESIREDICYDDEDHSTCKKNELLRFVMNFLSKEQKPMTSKAISEQLNEKEDAIKEILKKLVQNKQLKKSGKPTVYELADQGQLFNE